MNKIINQSPENAIWQYNDSHRQDVHFYSANGFPSGVYHSLLSLLGQNYNVSALGCRATWPNIGEPPRNRGWQVYAEDLIKFIDRNYETPIIGIGHSMGATCTILAAEKRPDLFKAVVLIEPAMVSRPLAILMQILPKSIVKHLGPARSTLKKPDHWNSRESFLAYCRKFSGYKRIADETFEAMAKFSVTETPDGQFKLQFPKEWEAHNYTQPPNVITNLKRLKVPSVAIRGNPSMFFTDATWKAWQKGCPTTIFKEIFEYGHLFPLENPSVCYELINAGLSEIT